MITTAIISVDPVGVQITELKDKHTRIFVKTYSSPKYNNVGGSESGLPLRIQWETFPKTVINQDKLHLRVVLSVLKLLNRFVYKLSTILPTARPKTIGLEEEKRIRKPQRSAYIFQHIRPSRLSGLYNPVAQAQMEGLFGLI